MFRAVVIRSLFVVGLAGPAVAQSESCPIGPDIKDQLDSLFALTQAAPNAAAVQPLVNGMWHLWMQAPNDHAQALLDEGLAHIRYADYDAAKRVLGQLVTYCPQYAEGYNQRAYAHFLAGDYLAALADLDVAQSFSPRHLGVLTGKARTLLKLGREAQGERVLNEALALNPWLAERHLLETLKGVEL